MNNIRLKYDFKWVGWKYIMIFLLFFMVFKYYILAEKQIIFYHILSFKKYHIFIIFLFHFCSFFSIFFHMNIFLFTGVV